MTPVVWATSRTDVAARGYWDQTMLQDLFDRVAWAPVGGCRFEHRTSFTEEGSVVVIPGRMEPDAGWLNEQIAPLPWVLIIVTSDEEGRFPWQDLTHPNMRIWVQTPHPDRHQGADGFLPVGYTPGTRDTAAELASDDRILEWAFAGQVTHDRRRAMLDQLHAHPEGGLVVATDRFADGVPHTAFMADLCNAKTAPCPGGPQTPDTFRLWEALQAGCVPLVDTKAGERPDLGDYWGMLFTDAPFPMIGDWAEFRTTLERTNRVWHYEAARAGAWWLAYQRRLSYALTDTVCALAGSQPEQVGVEDLVTVLVPTSPVPANPDIGHLIATLSSLADRGLGGCETMIMCDGVRPVQSHLETGYHAALQRLVQHAQHDWPRVLPIVHDSHQHQARMTRHALSLVRTPLVLFVEHDCPLVGPAPDWEALAKIVTGGEANLIRFHHEPQVLDEHRHLMPGEGPETVDGVNLWKCAQWSQRPHLASANYYRRILGDWFAEDDRWMVEAKMHGVLQTAWEDRGMEGWGEHRVWMYHEPVGGSIKRSATTDARGDEPSWEDS